MNIYKYLCIYIHKYIHIYTYTNIHACTHAHMLTHTYTYIHTTYIDKTLKNMKKKLVLYSKVKRNQADRYRFCKADMEKHVASIV